MLWRPIGLWDVEAPTFSRQSAHRCRWGCQHHAPVLISVKRWVYSRALVRLEGLGQLKNPMTSSGIEPATFRLVLITVINSYNHYILFSKWIRRRLYPLALKMEATYSSEKSDDLQWTTWGYIPEDRTLRNHRYENLIFYRTLSLRPCGCALVYCASFWAICERGYPFSIRELKLLRYAYIS
jgi:hypothetical protein